MTVRAAVLAVALGAACGSAHPALRDFDDRAGSAEVQVGGDGFGVYDGERLPLDLIVLRLRWRTRAMDYEARSRRFVVRLRLADGLAGGDAAARAQQELFRMIDELYVMGVHQVKLL
jgi:hypothetical protein